MKERQGAFVIGLGDGFDFGELQIVGGGEVDLHAIIGADAEVAFGGGDGEGGWGVEAGGDGKAGVFAVEVVIVGELDFVSRWVGRTVKSAVNLVLCFVEGLEEEDAGVVGALSVMTMRGGFDGLVWCRRRMFDVRAIEGVDVAPSRGSFGVGLAGRCRRGRCNRPGCCRDGGERVGTVTV